MRENSRMQFEFKRGRERSSDVQRYFAPRADRTDRFENPSHRLRSLHTGFMSFVSVIGVLASLSLSVCILIWPFAAMHDLTSSRRAFIIVTYMYIYKYMYTDDTYTCILNMCIRVYVPDRLRVYMYIRACTQIYMYRWCTQRSGAQCSS